MFYCHKAPKSTYTAIVDNGKITGYLKCDNPKFDIFGNCAYCFEENGDEK